MARNLKPVNQLDFSGGANLVVNPYLIAQKQVADARNLLLDEHGSLRTRDGLLTLTTSSLTTQPILYRGVLVRVSGSIHPFAIQRKTDGTVNQLRRTDTWAVVGSDFATAEPLPDSVTINDTAILLNGYEVPATYDGTTKGLITAGMGQTVPPGAKHGTFHLGSLWLWNTNATTTSLDGPSSVRMSDPNNFNSWPNANQTFISKDDGQVGMGMSSFTIVETGISPTSTLVLFKNYSAYQVTGVFGSLNFSVQRIKSDMGCISPRTIQFVSGFGIIRLTHKGFALYNGVEDRLISEEVRPAIFGGRMFDQLDFTNVNRAWASQSQNPPLYVAACPVSGTGLTRIFIYDLIRRGWTICDFPETLSCMNLFLTPAQFPTIHAGTLTGGKILELFSGQESDNGVDITWLMRSKAFFSGSQMQPAFWRRSQISVEGPPNNRVFMTAIVDGARRTTQVFNFPDSAEDSVQTVFSLDIMETANNVQIELSGTGRCYIRGLEMHTSPKPITKYTSRA